ncbi:uncharacterized protein LOC131240798 isoform X2 [Magnolia sinica]|uniref:uncharacterized protein LOC131240798 isoform X2 n=1 Tax=Magnolia sinica TaxID=86752 RepID=UPI002657B3CE|nr:uncharacterized protein LOC131240798 isoform X2 [Magnolia sinica]
MDAAEGDDHYEILGLPSGEEGAKLTPEDIKKAYRAKALSSHPDKRPDDPHAHSTFQKITSSYDILKNPDARKAFDALLRARNDRLRRVFHLDSKRRRMMSDLEERERAAFAVDPEEKARAEEERAARKFQEEVTKIREMHAKKKAAVAEEGSGTGEGLEKARVLKVSWERDGEDYSAERLKKLFTRFGKVEDVVIRGKGSKKKRSALVVMATKEGAVAASQSMRGDISNPLDVVPLHPDDNHLSSTPPMKHAKSDAPSLSNLVGAGYQAYEDSILKKLQKAAEKQKS